MTQLNVLVVDDHKLSRRMISSIPSEMGYQVFEAEDAKSALDILMDEHISILVTDFEMGEMNGIELYCEAKKQHNLLRAILLTGRLPISSMPDVIALGFDDCIPKTLSKEILPESLIRCTQICEMWKLRAGQFRSCHDSSLA
ncbi:MAG: response regulator [Planctomycetes bacterium]|nr:response regulator [Planctomycetota bacterium]